MELHGNLSTLEINRVTPPPQAPVLCNWQQLLRHKPEPAGLLQSPRLELPLHTSLYLA
jgi:hypothetical protein